MKALLSLIGEYIDLENANEESLVKTLTMTGTMVEKVENLSRENDPLVIGRIVKIEPHPNADKLKICKVDIGDTVIQIVTAAPNIYEGMLSVIAQNGTELFGGHKIKTSLLRGEKSEGMMCSFGEIGFNSEVISKEDSLGIIDLDEGKPGDNFFEYFDLDKSVLELELTYNRPDCMSSFGLVKEFKAALEVNEKKEIDYPMELEKLICDGIKVYSKTDMCTSFLGLKIENIEIKSSSVRDKIKLMQLGIKPINNVVDATNYSALVSGNPCHAYDMRYIKNNEIYADILDNDIDFEAVDNNKYQLKKGDLVIKSGGETVSIAGVMGGADSSIKDDTKDIFLEFASFNKTLVRRTASRLSLRSEASSRFEKGIEAERTLLSIKTFLDYLNINVDKLYGFITPTEKRLVKIEEEKFEKLLGEKISKENIDSIFKRLDFAFEYNKNEYSVSVPKYRQDIAIKADLIEEIARLFGYNNITSNPLMSDGKNSYDDRTKFENAITMNLVGMGYREMINYSFISKDKSSAFIVDEEKLLILENPLGEDFSLMRPNLISGAINTLINNINKGADKLMLFEIGNVFAGSVNDYQEENLLMVDYNMGDFFDIKGRLENLLYNLSLDVDVMFKSSQNNYMHPGRSADIYIGDDYIGYIGELNPVIGDTYHLKERLYLSEINLDKIFQYGSKRVLFKEFSRFPSSTRDISILVDENIVNDDIMKLVSSVNTEYLTEFEIFDEYRGDGVEDGYKSLSYKMTFGSMEKTLKDSEVEEDYKKILKKLEDFGAKRR